MLRNLINYANTQFNIPLLYYDIFSTYLYIHNLHKSIFTNKHKYIYVKCFCNPTKIFSYCKLRSYYFWLIVNNDNYVQKQRRYSKFIRATTHCSKMQTTIVSKSFLKLFKKNENIVNLKKKLKLNCFLFRGTKFQLFF